MSTLSERIKLSRAYSGLTLDTLSEKIGVTASSLKNYIKDSKNVTVEIGQKIAHICGVDLVWFLTGFGEMIKDNKNQICNEGNAFQISNDGTQSEYKDLCEIASQFANKDAVLDINKDLLEVEKVSLEVFENIRSYIKGTKSAASVLSKSMNAQGKNHLV